MGIIEDLADLRASVEALRKAVGRHSRVPEQRWATVTTCTSTDIRVTFPGEAGEAIITRSTEAVWVGAQVLVQVQGRDRWIVGLAGATIPAGIEAWTASTTIPAGWLQRNGQAVSRSTYWRLFAAIGTTYGAGDSTTFNVPDLTGRVDMGPGNGRMVGNSGGEETHTLSVSEMPSHAHDQYVTSDAQAGSGIRKDYAGDAPSQMYLQGISTGYAGNGWAHNNLQPFMVSTPIIKF